ncbi:enoyl-CoA hydratase [Franzmannia qiaohouensis]|uniref:Enoyl-CoA hydratase n=1 Tax=Franzmannia qiaohouensis TaxID=1329370 RepID=A0ABU1H8Q6_9GAMM|nr:enoyl-CoA hydratase [Halomonas qiaohouensis]MDR5903830.1 enoyl-CoA hydratase [Halomonas qiaohouensis]
MSAQEKPPGYIDTTLDGGVLRIIICNEKRYNAMSLEMWKSVAKAVTDAQSNDDVRVIVLQGAGKKAFMSGADISEFKEKRSDKAQAQHYADSVNAAQSALRSSIKPTVAAIKGICMGGGMGLSLSCDLRYSTETAKFCMPAGKLGVGYAYEGIKRFVDIVGATRTAELFLTARTFSGSEAARIGLVNEVFSEEHFDKLVDERITSMAGYAPLTMQAVKTGIRCVLQEDDAPSVEEVSRMVTACFESDDYREGQAAFKEKRKPRFQGK